MPRKRSSLNVRSHLEHLQLVLEGLKKYGYCPAMEHECNSLRLFNTAILRKDAERRVSGHRKDIRLETS